MIIMTTNKKQKPNEFIEWYQILGNDDNPDVGGDGVTTGIWYNPNTGIYSSVLTDLDERTFKTLDEIQEYLRTEYNKDNLHWAA